MTAVNSQRRRRWRRRRWARLQCRHRALPGCLPAPCLRVLHISALCALCSPRCTKLCRVQSTYADWSTTKRRVSSGANPKPPELCGCGWAVWPGNKSNLDDVYGAADDDESSTIWRPPPVANPCGVPCGLLEVLLHVLLGCTRCLHAV